MSSPGYGTAAIAPVASAGTRAAAAASAWDIMYDQLVQFHQEHGHCRIPYSDESLRTLYMWAGHQRRRNSALPQQCRARLNALGFDWTSQQDQNRESRWNERFGRLEAHKDKYGDCLVSAGCEDHHLVEWVNKQRFDYRWEKLSDERVQRLESLGFDWNLDSEGGGRRRGSPPASPAGEQTSWDVMYQKLSRYYGTHGKCYVSKSWSPNLHNWILEQRRAYANNELSADKRLKLAQIHFSWMSQDEKDEEVWGKMFRSLEAYKVANGDCLVPRSYCEDLKLYKWAIAQRRVNRKGKLPRDRRDRLEGIGFCWNTSKASNDTSQSQRSWDAMYEKLARHYRTNGNCTVAPSRSADLHNWIRDQRVANANDELSADKRLKLHQIHFSWMINHEKLEEAWNKMFESLEAYKASNGDCLVPEAYQEDPKLYKWVQWQRRVNKTGKLPRHRRDRLQGIGFCWNTSKASNDTSQSQRRDPAPARARAPAPAAPAGGQKSWDVMYEKLARYYRTYGTCIVAPSRIADLHNWILEQRVANANNELSADQRLKLDRIHFAWMSKHEKYEEIWNKMFESLEAYKAANGDCFVPEAYHEDLKLPNWVRMQRHAEKEGKLPRHRRDRLEGIGFCWNTSKASNGTSQSQRSWDAMYEKLARYYRTNGNCIVAPSRIADLHNWILEQRVANANNEISADKRLKLDLIHFAWMSKHEKDEQIWNKMFESLEAHKAANGDCMVSRPYCEDVKLYNWVIKQRRVNTKGKLPQHRRDRLESVGFCWRANPKPKGAKQAPSLAVPETQPHPSAEDPTSVSLPSSTGQKSLQRWNLQLERLKIYQAWYGDCLVPTSYDKELAEWVSCQHYLCKIDKLGERRYGKLERIGFFSDTEAEKSLKGGTNKRGTSTGAPLAQSIAGAQDLPDGTSHVGNLARSPKRARVDGFTPFHGRGLDK